MHCRPWQRSATKTPTELLRNYFRMDTVAHLARVADEFNQRSAKSCVVTPELAVRYPDN